MLNKLSIDTDLGQETGVVNQFDVEGASGNKEATLEQTNHRLDSHQLRQRRPSGKKNVFAIMDTMQKEYIEHGDMPHNVFTPRLAVDAMSYASPLRRRSSRWSSRGSLGNEKGKGSNFSLLGGASKDSIESPDTMEGQPFEQPTIFRKSKSMELPELSKSPKTIKRSSQPTDMNAAAMERRRLSLESSSSRNIHLTKYYQSQTSLFSKSKNPSAKNLSAETEGVEEAEVESEELPDMMASLSLEKEKTLIHLTEMNNVFKRRRSNVMPPPSAMRMFRRVSSIDGSVVSFRQESVVDEDIATDEILPQTFINLFGKTVVEVDSKTYLAILSVLQLPVFRIFCLWVLWIVVGALFFTLFQGEGTSFSCGLYLSVSVGIGMFWMQGDDCNVEDIPGTKAFSIGKVTLIIKLLQQMRTNL
jgi:hypothetical protein